MLNAADRMKALGQQPAGGQQSSIFGSAGGLAQSIKTDARFRISLYPLIAADAPEMAMGIAACLAYLLEQHRDVRVYRCFAKIRAEDENAEIVREDYQFTAADWELEGLDDNVLLAGTLENRAEGGLWLRLWLDLSLLDSRDPAPLEFEFAALDALVSALPGISRQIIELLTGAPPTQLVLAYEPLADRDAAELHRLLENVFEWNLDVYLHLWNVDWAEADVLAQMQEMIDLCRSTASRFGFWCLGMMAKQVMQSGLDAIGEMTAPLFDASFDAFFAPGGTERQPFAHGVAALAVGLAAAGYDERASQLMERCALAGGDASIWIAFINIHLRAGQLADALDANQRALEEELEHPALYWSYAQLLVMSEANDWMIEAVLLIDPDEVAASEQVACEIIAALKRLLALQPDSLPALQLLLPYMIEVNDAELWDYFARLLAKDRAALVTGEVIERLADLADLSPAYDILQKHIESDPHAPYPHIFMAQLAIVDEEGELAKASIAACRELLAQPDRDIETELQRLELSAVLPDFERRFGEIKMVLHAKGRVADADVEFVEDALDIAPQLAELYTVLARCYQGWGDVESAYDVLQDAEQKLGAVPPIVQGLVGILWGRNQREAAVAKLNAALDAFPSDVHLLAQMAHCLIENGQLADARQYIERAESIAPSHPAVWELRRLIAGQANTFD